MTREAVEQAERYAKARDAFIETVDGVQGGRPVIKGTRLTVSAIYGRCRVAIPSTTSRTTILTFQGKPSRRRFFMAKHTRKLGVRSRDAREERREVFVGECISSSLSRFLNAGGLQRSIR